MGAFQPDVSPDGKTIVFVGYSTRGYDLATIPFDEGTWMAPLAAPPAPSAIPESTANPTATPTPTPAADSSPSPLSSRPYSPWETLAPTFWLPIVSEDGAGNVFGAFTGGADALFQHLWTLQAWWSADGREPGYAAAYQGAWSWPRFDLSSSLSLAESPGPPDRLQRVWTYADTGLTFTWTRLARSLALRVSWSGTRFESVEAPAFSFPVAARIRFEDGFLSDASVQASYTDARRFVHSISPEQGRTASIRLRLAAPEIGSDYALARARASIAQYVRLPLTRHAVVALRLAGGAADGTLGGNAPFELGGLGQLDPLSFLPGAIPGSPDQLRGYETGALAGTGFVLGNLELRVPLGAPLFGRSTWPLFLRRVHGALFLDAGDAFDLPGELPFAGHRLDPEELRASAGVELRLEIVLGYHLRTDLRLGAARTFGAVLGRGRAADRALGLRTDPVVFFVVLGPSF
jgi:hypothetical protein